MKTYETHTGAPGKINAFTRASLLTSLLNPDTHRPPFFEKVVNFPQAAPDEQETPKRGIWHRPQKRQKKENKKKRTQARKAAPDEQEILKRGIWHRPQKRQKKKKNPSTKGSSRRARNTQARDLASPPKKVYPPMCLTPTMSKDPPTMLSVSCEFIWLLFISVILRLHPSTMPLLNGWSNPP